MGLFDSLISGVSNFFGDSGDTSVADDLSSIGSELGGSLLDQLKGAGGSVGDINPNFGGNAGDLFGGIFGQGAMPNVFGTFPTFGGDGGINPGAGTSDPSIPPLDTSIPITLGGTMGGDLSTLGTFGPFVARRTRGVPWKRITRMVRTAVKYFGPGVALSIVQQIAAYLGALGVQDATGNPVTGGEILFRALQQSGGRRSSRGITGRQMSITGKTIRKLNAMHSKISAIARSGHARSSRAPAPFTRRRRHTARA